MCSLLHLIYNVFTSTFNKQYYFIDMVMSHFQYINYTCGARIRNFERHPFQGQQAILYRGTKVIQCSRLLQILKQFWVIKAKSKGTKGHALVALICALILGEYGCISNYYKKQQSHDIRLIMK